MDNSHSKLVKSVISSTNPKCSMSFFPVHFLCEMKRYQIYQNKFVSNIFLFGHRSELE